ncbi:MAG: hypothetical protein IJT36_02860 [Alphaproteobacteria bacterium]|nr:hypothetical protein [Alphaproteobacteria bacterium]
MKNVNELEKTFIDEDGKEWHKVHSKDYVIMTDEEPWIGTAILFSTGKH